MYRDGQPPTKFIFDERMGHWTPATTILRHVWVKVKLVNASDFPAMPSILLPVHSDQLLCAVTYCVQGQSLRMSMHINEQCIYFLSSIMSGRVIEPSLSVPFNMVDWRRWPHEKKTDSSSEKTYGGTSAPRVGHSTQSTSKSCFFVERSSHPLMSASEVKMHALKWSLESRSRDAWIHQYNREARI